MKRTYIIPGMTVVRLQHQSIICQSGGLRGIRGGDVGYGGASSDYDGEVRTRESSGVWDEEW